MLATFSVNSFNVIFPYCLQTIGSGKVGSEELADLNQQVKAETSQLRARIKELDDLALECLLPEDRDVLLKESRRHCEEMTK